MINAYAGRERPRGWSFLAHHWELIIVSLGNNLCQAVADIRSAYDTLSSQISEQADYYRRQNAIADQRQREAQAASQ